MTTEATAEDASPLPACELPPSRDSTKTLMGIGIASLLRRAQPVNVGAAVAPAWPVTTSDRPDSVLVAGEIDCRVAIEPEATRASSPRQPPRRRPALLAALALALSLGAGFGVFRVVTGRDVLSQRRNDGPLATPPPLASTRGAAATRDAEVLPIVHSLGVEAAAASASAAAVHPRAAREVDLGDGSCSLVVSSAPGGEVTVDDQASGPTPVAITGLWCGRRVAVRVIRPGFEAWTRRLTPEEGRVSRVAARLARPLSARARSITQSTSPAAWAAVTEPRPTAGALRPAGSR